jgi:hypothetical protein
MITSNKDGMVTMDIGKNNFAVQLLEKTQQEFRTHVERYWDLVIACRTKYKPEHKEYAQKKEMEHLHSAAHYENQARDCEKALQDLELIRKMEEEISPRNQSGAATE